MNLTDKMLKEILSEQKKVETIIIELSHRGIEMSPRTWRRFVRDYNDAYGEHDRYIASDNQGYYLTMSKKKITKTAIYKLRNGLSMVRNAKKDLQNLSEKNQLSLLEEDVDIYDLIMKIQEL